METVAAQCGLTPAGWVMPAPPALVHGAVLLPAQQQPVQSDVGESCEDCQGQYRQSLCLFSAGAGRLSFVAVPATQTESATQQPCAAKRGDY